MKNKGNRKSGRTFSTLVAVLPAMLIPLLVPSVLGILAAHTGPGSNIHLAESVPLRGLWQGFTHPLLGTDHLLVFIALGCYVAFNIQSQWRKFTMLFVTVLLLSALAGNYFATKIHSFSSGIELAISSSIIFAGLLLFVPMKPTYFTAISWLFAMLHGSVHGVEVPVGSSPILFSIGMALASAAVILTTILLVSALGSLGTLKNPRNSDKNTGVLPALAWSLTRKFVAYSISLAGIVILSVQLIS